MYQIFRVLKQLEEVLQPTDEEVVERFLVIYLSENGGLQMCRHGGCFELADEFQQRHPDAEMWETWELPSEFDRYPLKLEFDTVNSILKTEGVSTFDEMGGTGGHAVVVWHGLVFDAAGISTFESITQYFHTLRGVHWVRTQ